MKKYLPALVSGFAAAVITVIPGLESISFCFIIPGAAAFALYLDQKATGDYDPIKGSKAFAYGLFTAIFITLFSVIIDSVITLITHTNSFVRSLPQSEAPLREMFNNIDPKAAEQAIEMLREVASQIKNNGFSPIYLVFSFIGNLFMYSIICTIGAFVGMLFINRRNLNNQNR